MSLLYGVRSRQVVVLSSVYRDVRVRTDQSGDVLIGESPEHVDVSEQDSIHGIVQKYVEAFERAMTAISGMHKPDA